MASRLTAEERALLARLAAEEDDDDSDAEDGVDEVEYQGRRYRIVTEEDDGPKPVKTKPAGKTAPKAAPATEDDGKGSPTPPKRRFVT
ncbi:MAG: hypothetical protein ACREQ5_01570 [Candidatus Dormibacteria bacterium]